MNDNCTIHRHVDEDPYSRVRKDMLDDPSLSWKSKGVLSYLLGKPQGWKLRIKDLVNRSNDGASAVTTALKELREAGYMKLQQTRSGGKIVAWVYHVADKSVFKKSFDLEVVNLEVENLVLENSVHSKNVTSNKIDSSKKDVVPEAQLMELLPVESKRMPVQLPSEAQFWNSNCGEALSAVMAWSPNRQKKLVQRRTDAFWVKHFEDAVRKIVESRFCLGENDRGWRASFDWLLDRPDAVAKVIEGKYDNRNSNYAKARQPDRNQGIVGSQPVGQSKAERVLARRRAEETARASVENSVAEKVA